MKNIKITNPVYRDLLKNNLISDNNLIITSKKTRDSNIPVLKDKKTKIIFLKSFSTSSKYYKTAKSHDKRLLKTKSQKKINYIYTLNNIILSPYLADDIRRAKNYNKIFKRKKILDFGCGWGNFLLSLNNECTKYGTEIGDNFLKFIKTNYKHINIKENILEFKDQFDYVTLFHVLHYLPNQIETLRIIRSKLKKKGKIIIEVPNAEDFLLQLKQFRNFSFCKEQLILHTEKSLSKFTKKAGFKNIKIRYYQRYDMNNHFGWFLKNKPGGHEFFKEMFKKSIKNDYSNFLKKEKITDTLILEAEK